VKLFQPVLEPPNPNHKNEKKPEATTKNDTAGFVVVGFKTSTNQQQNSSVSGMIFLCVGGRGGVVSGIVVIGMDVSFSPRLEQRLIYANEGWGDMDRIPLV
jgi:hypothetical protein